MGCSQSNPCLTRVQDMRDVNDAQRHIDFGGSGHGMHRHWTRVPSIDVRGTRNRTSSHSLPLFLVRFPQRASLFPDAALLPICDLSLPPLPLAHDADDDDDWWWWWERGTEITETLMTIAIGCSVVRSDDLSPFSLLLFPSSLLAPAVQRKILIHCGIRLPPFPPVLLCATSFSPFFLFFFCWTANAQSCIYSAAAWNSNPVHESKMEQGSSRSCITTKNPQMIRAIARFQFQKWMGCCVLHYLEGDKSGIQFLRHWQLRGRRGRSYHLHISVAAHQIHSQAYLMQVFHRHNGARKGFAC